VVEKVEPGIRAPRVVYIREPATQQVIRVEKLVPGAPEKLSPWLWVAGGAVAVLAVGGVAALLLRGRGKPSPAPASAPLPAAAGLGERIGTGGRCDRLAAQVAAVRQMAETRGILNPQASEMILERLDAAGRDPQPVRTYDEDW
jgi:hypothetical protein